MEDIINMILGLQELFDIWKTIDREKLSKGYAMIGNVFETVRKSINEKLSSLSIEELRIVKEYLDKMNNSPIIQSKYIIDNYCKKIDELLTQPKRS